MPKRAVIIQESDILSKTDLSRAIPGYNGPYFTPKDHAEAKEILEPFHIKRSYLERLTDDDLRKVHNGLHNCDMTYELLSSMNPDEILPVPYTVQTLKESHINLAEKVKNMPNFEAWMSWCVSQGLTKSKKMLMLRNKIITERPYGDKPGDLIRAMKDISDDTRKAFVESLKAPRKYSNLERNRENGEWGTDFHVVADQREFYIDGIMEKLRTYVLESKGFPE